MTQAEAPQIGPGVSIRHGIPQGLRAEAAALYWQAFGPKLNRVLGPDERALRFLWRVMRLDNAFAAIDAAGRLIGIAGYRSRGGSFAGGTTTDLRAIYGRPGAAWRAALLSRLGTAPEDAALRVEGICVAPDHRGQGIGAALIAALAAEARRQGHPALRLEVVESNWRAQQLYERLGFLPEHRHETGLLRHVFGYEAATSMLLPLFPTAAEAAPPGLQS